MRSFGQHYQRLEGLLRREADGRGHLSGREVIDHLIADRLVGDTARFKDAHRQCFRGLGLGHTCKV